jgi:predicted transcriptional regulator
MRANTGESREKRKTVAFMLGEDDDHDLEIVAERLDRSKAWCMRKAIKDFLDKEFQS